MIIDSKCINAIEFDPNKEGNVEFIIIDNEYYLMTTKFISKGEEILWTKSGYQQLQRLKGKHENKKKV